MDDLSERAAHSNAVPLGSGSHSSAMMRQQQQRLQRSQQFDCSLEDICRNVIVANLERYAPSSFSSCFEDDWEDILRLRHVKTKPKEGSGGLDGTGRVAPAISDKILTQIELENPHLAECVVADQLVWHDCVEYRFRRDGLTRPRALYLPWPLLLERVKELSEKLQGSVVSMIQPVSSNNGEDDAEALQQQQHDSNLLRQVVHDLSQLPMNVSLLHVTGVGKTVSKALKKLNKSKQTQTKDCIPQLEQLLQSWKDLAGASDDKQKKQLKSPKRNGKMAASPTTRNNNNSPIKKQAAETELADLETAEKCSNWRELFHALKQREEDRRSSQGKRMREIRRNLASGRPKVVKVRPTSAKQQRILASPAERRAAARGILPSSSSLSAAGSKSKLGQIRREATMQLSRSKAAPPAAARVGAARSSQKRGASFGDAVAFVSGTKQKRPQTRTLQRVNLTGGRVMAVPRTARGVGRSAAAAASAGAKRAASSSSTASGGGGGLRRKLGSKFPKLQR